MLGSHNLRSLTMTPVKFAELNLTYKDSLNNAKTYDFLITQDEL
jgi:hypothetical protein